MSMSIGSDSQQNPLPSEQVRLMMIWDHPRTYLGGMAIDYVKGVTEYIWNTVLIKDRIAERKFAQSYVEHRARQLERMMVSCIKEKGRI